MAKSPNTRLIGRPAAGCRCFVDFTELIEDVHICSWQLTACTTGTDVNQWFFLVGLLFCQVSRQIMQRILNGADLGPDHMDDVHARVIGAKFRTRFLKSCVPRMALISPLKKYVHLIGRLPIVMVQASASSS